MPPVGFEPTNPASERPQTYALDRTVTGTGSELLQDVNKIIYQSIFNTLNAELNPICHLLALLGGATIVVVSRLRVNSFH